MSKAPTYDLGTAALVRNARRAAPTVQPPTLEDEIREALAEPEPDTIPSAIPGVSDAAWTRFLAAMQVAPLDAVSASNGYGMFEMKMRRLADLGMARNVSMTRDPDSGRMVWVGDFVPPYTAERFLGSEELQRRVLGDSMRRYVDGLRDGTIAKPAKGWPRGATLSGVLAILHRCGPNGLETWTDESKRFPDTAALFARTNGAF